MPWISWTPRGKGESTLRIMQKSHTTRQLVNIFSLIILGDFKTIKAPSETWPGLVIERIDCIRRSKTERDRLSSYRGILCNQVTFLDSSVKWNDAHLTTTRPSFELVPSSSCQQVLLHWFYIYASCRPYSVWVSCWERELFLDQSGLSNWPKQASTRLFSGPLAYPARSQSSPGFCMNPESRDTNDPNWRQ